MEDDRLALLEHRLLRMKQQLLKQRAELLQFLDALSPRAPEVVGGGTCFTSSAKESEQANETRGKLMMRLCLVRVALAKDDGAEEVHVFTSTQRAVELEDQE